MLFPSTDFPLTMNRLPSDQNKAVLAPRRFFGPGLHTYETQLGIDVARMTDECLSKKGTIRILDVWGQHGVACSDVTDLLKCCQKTVVTTVLDLPETAGMERPLNTGFVGGNIEDEEFRSSLATMPKQNVIFMNQVSQYLDDRLGTIKFIFDHILENEGSFYFNILSGGFLSNRIPEFVIFDALDSLWSSAKWVSIRHNQTTIRRRVFHQYHLRKTLPDASLPIPTYKYSQIEEIKSNLVNKKSAYDFREYGEFQWE